ncbi:acetyl-CoA carboxylase biotin carboxyl carrier protein [Bacillus testis]|uniref:acetyl-CoA carboxylase biotin carboxyl carrier protein n=1 Tax=Bacillus testis TaxID=1622072 RepID=UPI00067F443F|nr:acetyl-CoA carboxylase biotin carboxyl carrier protein [Bacillus testis]
MLKVQEIREIIKLIDSSSIQEFNFEQDGTKIKMKKAANEVSVVQQPIIQAAPVENPVVPAQPAQAQPKEAAPSQPAAPANEASPAQDENLHKIISPMVGTFYSSPSPEEAPYVQKGMKVTEEGVVCIVEAMKLFNEITAEVNGEIVEILVKDGQLVEYGQPLFLVKAE